MIVRCDRNLRRDITLTVLTAGSCLWFGLAWAQEPAKPIASGAANANEFDIIRLKNIPAPDMANTLSQAFAGGNLRLIADPNSNTILVSASPADRIKIRQIVQQLE